MVINYVTPNAAYYAGITMLFALTPIMVDIMPV